MIVRYYELRSLALAPEEGKASRTLWASKLPKKNPKKWWGSSQGFHLEIENACIFTSKKNGYGKAGCTTVSDHVSSAGLGLLSDLPQHMGSSCSQSVQNLSMQCNAKRTYEVKLSIVIHMTVPSCSKFLMTVCKSRRCQSDRNIYIPAIWQRKRHLLRRQ